MRRNLVFKSFNANILLTYFFIIIYATFGYDYVNALNLYENCPLKCTCIGHRVDCRDLNLVEAPRNLPFWTITLDLSSNQIESFSRSVFSKLPRLETLDLTSNSISKLYDGSFSALHNLKILKLSRNKIDSIDNEAFDGLINLRSLDLSQNLIKSIEAMTFKPLSALKNLSLSRNEIAEMDDASFWGLNRLESLNFNHNRIKAIQHGWLYGLASLTALDLSANDVAWIEPSAFTTLISLKWLSLASNHIRSIPPLIFRKSSHVIFLSMAHNHIDTIQENALAGLDSLDFLDLSDNALAACVEEDTMSIGTIISSLHVLKLTTNRIRVISSRAFEFFPNLRTLDLSDNPIATLQKGAFEPLHLEQLIMNTSSLVCDCELNWFSTWILSSNTDRNTIVSVCHFPISLQGTNLASMHVSNFSCVEDSPRARLLQHPVPLVKALLNTMVKLDCVGYGASPMKIVWRLSKAGVSRVLTDDSSTEIFLNRSKIVNGQIDGIETEYLESQLRLHGITFSDEAEYQCIIRNQFGSSYSFKSRIIVHQLPVFHVSPSNVSIVRGEIAMLRCSAHGVPPPLMKWQKDGGDFFLAAVEKRLYVKSNDDTLYIVNVSLADAGIYTCRVSNEAGKAEKSAHVHVFKDFRPQLEDKRVVAGTTVFFSCLTNGQPKVNVDWFHDNERLDPLATPSHVSFKAGSQILIIKQADISDSGSYRCEYTVGSDILKSAASKLVLYDSMDEWNRCCGDLKSSKSNPYIIIAICGILILAVLTPVMCIYFFSKDRDCTKFYTLVIEKSQNICINSIETKLEEDNAQEFNIL